MKRAGLDIRKIALEARRFKKRLEEVKAGLSETSFQWYPYDSLACFDALITCLTGERRFLLDLIRDKPILDIGCGDGHVAFFLESVGCKVLAVDNPRTNFNQMQGVRALKSALNSSIEISEQDIDYNLRLPEGQYSAAFLFGILYHLKNPYRVLETLLTRSEYCILSTRVTRFTPAKQVDLSDFPVAYLVDEAETNSDSTNYWIFTNSGLKRLLRRSGWRVIDYTTLGNTDASDPVSSEGDERAYCLAERTGGPITSGLLLSGWHDQESFEDWRWTERTFSVAFPDGAQEDQFVKLRFFLPPAIEDRFGTVTIRATINGYCLPGRSFTNAGQYVYNERVPEEALLHWPAIVEFSLSQALPPSEQDSRELGLIVLKVSLEKSIQSS